MPDRKSVVSGKRGDLGDWSSDVFSSDLGVLEQRCAYADVASPAQATVIDRDQHLSLAVASPCQIGRASCRASVEISVTGVQTCSLPIWEYLNNVVTTPTWPRQPKPP